MKNQKSNEPGLCYQDLKRVRAVAAAVRGDLDAGTLRLYAVVRDHRSFDVDSGSGDGVAWFRDGGAEVSERRAADLEHRYRDSGIEPRGYCRAVYKNVSSVVTMCCTIAGARQVMRRQVLPSSLRIEPRPLTGNPEMLAVLRFLATTAIQQDRK